MDSSIEFMLNGRCVTVDSVEPTTLLVDYLHRPDVGLQGTRKSCGQGGCGSCTVMLSKFNSSNNSISHSSINSCLRPLASLDGMAVTTTEGCGNTRTGVSEVQWRIAKENGSQCGYCTAGWVMTMHAFLVSKGNEKPSKEEIEDTFDGNICRCTGYRPILYAMQHFAKDFKRHPGAMTCEVDPAEKPKRLKGDLISPTLPTKWAQRRPLQVSGRSHRWYRPVELDKAIKLIEEHRSFENLKLVVGNTSIGVYDLFTEDPAVYIDISQIQELRAHKLDDTALTLGGALTYSETINILGEAIGSVDESQCSGLKALNYMAGRTAGHVVRNAASLAGNTMLELRHINEGTPFPSDMFAAFATVGAEVSVHSSVFSGVRRLPILEFAALYAATKELRQDALIVSYHVPLTTEGEYVQAFKTALRKENSHSITNAGFRVRFDQCGRVEDACVVIGGIASAAFEAVNTCEVLIGHTWPSTPSELVKAVTTDIQSVIDNPLFIERMKSVPDEGFSDLYRLQLAQSFAYKFWIEVATARDLPIPAALTSAIAREPQAISTGTQRYSTYKDEFPVNRPFIKLSSFLQACGEADYVHDMELPPRCLHGRFVTSAAAKASFSYTDYDDSPIKPSQIVDVLNTRFDGISHYVTGADVPFNNNQSLPAKASSLPGNAPQVPDPLFCLGDVTTHGQPIGMILANDPVVAERAAHDVSTRLIRYTQEKPILTIEEAVEAGSIFTDAGMDQAYPSHIWKITRPGSELGWVGEEGACTLDEEPCSVVSSRLEVGSQIHFYMETQSAMAVPGESDTLVIYSSTQSPNSVQSTVCDVLGLSANKVQVRNTRVGGAYGGKTTRSPRPAAAVAVASHVSGEPVHVAMRRETDTAMIGHRHPVRGDVHLAIASGDGQAKRGKILGLHVDFIMNGGNTYDASFTMSNVLQLRCDSAYMVPNYETSSDVAKTNIASNGAMRSVGAMQGVMIIEDAIEKASVELGICADSMRESSLYQLGDTVPDGQPLDYCYMKEVWAYTRETCDYDKRKRDVEKFNRENKWVKRGIALIPVKYASGYNASFLEQAGALIEVYGEDGSVLVRQGGVEIGQGLHTMIAQVAARALNIPLSLIQIAGQDTGVVPNPVSTGASTGTGFNAAAVTQACEELKARLQDYALGLLTKHGDKWCRTNNIDFWNHPKKGWRHVDKKTGESIWESLISQAQKARVNLSAQARAAIKGGESAIAKQNLTFKPDAFPMTIDEFTGFTYSAACTEVEIDVLTGVTKVRRADIVYDIGHSLNPALDVGQVEGAFIQGLGYVTTEKLVWQSTGPNRGVANTLNTWTYKPPAHTTIPETMNVDLFPRERASNVPENSDLLLSSKEIGEPPLVLASSVYIAIKRAIISSRIERHLPAWVQMNSPATVQVIREACEVSAEQLTAES